MPRCSFGPPCFSHGILENIQVSWKLITDNIKDLGVIFDSKLKFCKHVDDKVNKAYQNLGIIKRNFIHLTANCFIGPTFI